MTPMQRTIGTHWVFRLIPPRPTFDEDMTDDEGEIMGRHAEYWAAIAERGRIVAYGPVRDGTGAWGLGVIESDDEDEVRAMVFGDPAVTSGMARMELGPMLVAIVRAAG
jgi:uncharacterized protein YciI